MALGEGNATTWTATLGTMVMSSDYNNATVQAVTYHGPGEDLNWGLQHDLCIAAGRAMLGSSAWAQPGFFASTQNFTHVSGSLGGGVGYMCAGSVQRQYCDFQVRVEGTSAASSGRNPDATLRSGDAVFCSA